MSIAFNPGEPVPLWRVGVFVSSSRRPKHVVMVAVGEKEIAEYEAHRDFVRWVSPAPSHDPSAMLLLNMPLAKSEQKKLLDGLCRLITRCGLLVLRVGVTAAHSVPETDHKDGGAVEAPSSANQQISPESSEALATQGVQL